MEGDIRHLSNFPTYGSYKSHTTFGSSASSECPVIIRRMFLFRVPIFWEVEEELASRSMHTPAFRNSLNSSLSWRGWIELMVWAGERGREGGGEKERGREGGEKERGGREERGEWRRRKGKEGEREEK